MLYKNVNVFKKRARLFFFPEVRVSADVLCCVHSFFTVFSLPFVILCQPHTSQLHSIFPLLFQLPLSPSSSSSSSSLPHIHYLFTSSFFFVPSFITFSAPLCDNCSFILRFFCSLFILARFIYNYSKNPTLLFHF